MSELVGHCSQCQKAVYCEDGFFNGVVEENGQVTCFPCRDHAELISLLNQLLEAEKAGVEALAYMQTVIPEVPLLRQVKDDEAWSCRGLIAALKRENGQISKNTGDFASKLKAIEGEKEKLILLNKGQAWTVRRIDQAMKLAMSAETKEFLTEMKNRHNSNINQCEQQLL